MQRTALVTGASSGIGLATASALVKRGYRVLGTSRDPATVTQPAAGVEYVALDLTSDASIAALADLLGGVDVLVNNAGESQSGPFEELPMDALRRLFQVNVLGPVRLAQLALPGMRGRGYGRVVMVGSMLASFPLAYRSSYVATKAAVKGFATAARHEYSPFGVWLTTVEPGSINTGISERRTRHVADGSPHRADFDRMLTALDRNEKAGISAETVAATILTAIEAERPRQRYAVGSNAPLVFALRRLVPARLVETITHRRHDLRR
ncbi:alcohol dehydrogenase [Actinoplanes sp. SE50]|uniref:SDR family oxidoreductase n=1 Tax=unclassified Actinoplanes TaxID=2626549 RepID=UPI00023ECECF|nr:MULTISPECIES: SDR family oxidoreductase [unclassified Actinoplanes]AEV85500.1 3-oxoacyl-[acyl-carrier-protein] reductase [Actinoplanes sp. SE50/110]ATO83893.1 alcohol dehydrogenase [Actinoplanes sp. SE50]SLM01303.1 short-chain dehydrogenase/reductase [Actinoplanes sp. SE50/110]